MLVLTRRAAEKIQIGPDIEVIVVEIRGGKCRLGIIAPPDVQIDRPDAVSHTPKDRGVGKATGEPS